MESTELQSACVSLGFKERTGYALEPDCLATVKLLIRFLRNEPDGHSVRYQLGYARIVQNDLIPMLQYHSADRELSDAVLRLLLNLSQPTLVCFNGRVPNDRPTRKIFIELDQFLCTYKQAFSDVDFLKVITASMAKLVKSESEGNLREEDRLVLERYLLLIRNILHIDDAKFKNNGLAGEDLSGPGAHDELLLAISHSGLDRLLQYLASSAEEHGFALHVLEILWLLFKDITPSLLVAASKNDGSGALKLSSDDLNEIRRQSLGGSGGSVNRNANQTGGSYRAELRGTFSVQNKWLSPANPGPGSDDNAGGSMVIHKHKGPNDAASAMDVISNSKKRAKKSCQRDIALEDTLEKQRGDVISTVRPAVRDFLASFARRLLVDASGYNNLMAAADRIITNSPADSHDESFYLWAVSFFMELARGLVGSNGFTITKAVECVGQTLGLEALTFIHTNMTTYADGLDTDRFDKQMWNKRLVLAVRAFNEQIAWADALARCKDDSVAVELGRTLVFNIVYEPQFRDILPQLLHRYKESRHCRAYLRSLVAATHSHLKLMDYLQSTGCETVVVAQKGKTTKKAKKSAKKKDKKRREDFVKQPWSDVVIALREVLLSDSNFDDDFMADDPIVRGVVEPALSGSTAEADEVVKNQSIVSRIGQILLRHEPKYAFAALKMARKLFPEHAERFFGGSSGDDEKFFEFLYESSEFVEDDSEPDEKENEQQVLDEDDDEEVGVSKSSSGRETYMNVADIAAKFCNVATFQPYISLLETWSSNDTETNHYLARFFKRIAIDWHLPAMVYQLRIFAACQQLLNAAESAAACKVTPPAPELVSFAKFAVNGFLKLAQQVGKTAFLEIVFWKNRIDALAFASNYEDLRSKQQVAEEDAGDAPNAKKSGGKKGAKKAIAENGEEIDAETGAFDRLLEIQEGAPKRDEASSDDADDEAWLKLVDKKEPSTGQVEVVEGETKKKPKKRTKKVDPDRGKAKNGDEKKAKKRRAKSGDEKRPASSENSNSNHDEQNEKAGDDDSQEAKSAKRAKILFESSDDEDEVLAITKSNAKPADKELDKISLSSFSSLELEIVADESEKKSPENKKKPAEDDEDVLLKNARLHLSDSDEESGSDLEKTAATTQRKKTRRLISSSDED